MAQKLLSSVRTLLRHPWSTLFVVATLGISIGANAAAFSMVYSILFRALPFSSYEELTMVWLNEQEGVTTGVMSWPDFLDLRKHNQTFTDLTAFNISEDQMTGAGEPENLWGAVVSPSFFSVLRAEPLLGSFFTSNSETHPDPNVVVISHALWKRRFGGDPSILGRTLVLSGVPHEVIGVTGPDFRHPEPLLAREAEIWKPLVIRSWMENRAAKFLRVIGRLKGNTDLSTARSDLGQILRASGESSDSKAKPAHGVNLIPLRDQLVGHLRPGLMILMTIMGILFLVACANVGNFLLVRTLRRDREFVIRYSLGAKQSSLVAALLSESSFLCIAAAMFALLFGYWGGMLLSVRFPDFVPGIKPIGFDSTAVAFTLALSVLSLLLVSFPSLLKLRLSGIGDLQANLRGPRGRSVTALRNAFIAAEISAALTLFIVAALLGQSLIRLYRVDPGFDSRNVLTFRLSLPSRYSEPIQIRNFFNQLIEELGTVPGVASVGAVSTLPLTGLNDIEMPFAAESSDSPEGSNAHYQAASPGYFSTMRILPLRGRYFNSTDRADGEQVVILSNSAAKHFWPDGKAVGRRVRFNFGDNPSENPWMTVVGVVEDVKSLGLTTEAPFIVYRPLAQEGFSFTNIVVRTSMPPLTVADAIKKKVYAADPDLPLADLEEMDAVLMRATARARFLALLANAIALIAVLVAALGVSSVISYLVGQARHEIGIRIALGALESDILKVFVRPVMALTLVGVIVSLAGVHMITPILSALLFGIRTVDPLTVIAACIIISIISILSSYIPARAAVRIDPREAFNSPSI